MGTLAVVIALVAAGPAAAGRYTVRSGDTLSGIAARHGVSVRALADANGIADVHQVRAGTRLTIPGAPAAGAPAAGRYTVRSGDTLSGIAARHGVSVRALAQANGIGNVHLVRIGASLVIPGGGRQGTSASAGTYTVRPGDNLSTIAGRHGVSVRALADANGLTDIHLVRIGSKLSIPSSDLAPAASAAAPAGARGPYPARLRSSPSRLALVPVFEKWAATYGVPVDLLMALTWLESGWQNHVVSSAGAIGIGQLLPDTVTWMSDVVIGVPLDASDPDDNIRMSARYLRWLLDRTGGDVVTALAGYYQGLGSVRAAGVYQVSKVYAANVLAVRDRWF